MRVGVHFVSEEKLSPCSGEAGLWGVSGEGTAQSLFCSFRSLKESHARADQMDASPSSCSSMGTASPARSGPLNPSFLVVMDVEATCDVSFRARPGALRLQRV